MEHQGRYAAQERFLGADAQARLAEASAAVVGVGATGSAIADILARAGVGRLRLIDRDVIEAGNLHRQVLYDEASVDAGLPKAEAARQRLGAVNSQVEVEVRVSDLLGDNALSLLDGVDLVLDGTDNFATRYVINDACASLGVPWVYAGVVGAQVHGFPVVWGRTACFRCYLDAAPPPGATATCDTAGVIGPAVLVAAGLAATEGLKLLSGRGDDVAEGLLVCDVWTRDLRRLGLRRHPDCPTCAGCYEHLEGGVRAADRLCGRDAVGLPSPPGTHLDLDGLAASLQGLGEVRTCNAFLLRFVPADRPEWTLTVFKDGRAIVQGTSDPAAARTLYARFVGG